MRLNTLFELNAGLAPRLVVNSPAFKSWFGNSKVVDSAGNPLPVYHGTARPDRVGTRFRKSRATAGPMAYFTDDPEMASNYATGKSDTSLGDEDTSYANWFKIKVGRSEVTIDRAWHFLPQEERARIAANAGHVHQNDDGEIIFDKDATNGPGGLMFHVKQHRGNVLAALVEIWLTGGVLFGEEVDFLTVLRLCGMTTKVRFDDPQATYSAVYAVYMSIQNPLVSTNISPKVIDELSKAAARQKGVEQSYAGWDKKRVDPRLWFRNLLDDIEATGGRLSWTIVPDWATAVLKKLGYDGIQDIGGKNGGAEHAVWIPFEENQIKSAISNTKFNPAKSGIHESVGDTPEVNAEIERRLDALPKQFRVPVLDALEVLKDAGEAGLTIADWAAAVRRIHGDSAMPVAEILKTAASQFTIAVKRVAPKTYAWRVAASSPDTGEDDPALHAALSGQVTMISQAFAIMKSMGRFTEAQLKQKLGANGRIPQGSVDSFVEHLLQHFSGMLEKDGAVYRVKTDKPVSRDDNMETFRSLVGKKSN